MRARKKKRSDVRSAKVLSALLMGNAKDAELDVASMFETGASVCRGIIARKKNFPFHDFEDEAAGILVAIALKLGERRGFLNASHDVEHAPAGAKSVRRAR